MKAKRFFAGLIVSGFSLLALAPAQAQVEQVVTDTGKELPQGPIDNNGVATVTQVAKPFTVSTKTLLGYLALDETFAGKWFAKYPNKVPPNAKLEIIFPFRANFSGLSYRVVSGTNVVDVSNILSASVAGTNQLQSGTHSDAKGVSDGPFTYTVYQEFTISYDARPVGGKLWFQVTGLATCSATGGKANAKTGKFLETDTFSLIDGTGAGVDTTGTAFSLSGVTVSASGSGLVGQLQPAAGPVSGDGYSLSGLQEISTGASDTQILAPMPPLQPPPQ